MTEIHYQSKKAATRTSDLDLERVDDCQRRTNDADRPSWNVNPLVAVQRQFIERRPTDSGRVHAYPTDKSPHQLAAACDFLHHVLADGQKD